jgi:phenylacetic acid degradation operon negative regulatory protein
MTPRPVPPRTASGCSTSSPGTEPADWARDRAQKVFLQIYDRLGPLAELRFRQVLAETDPALAELAAHHDSAKVAALGDRHPTGDTPFEQAAEARRPDEARRR